MLYILRRVSSDRGESVKESAEPPISRLIVAMPSD
jgi:hypothetical protein